MYLTMVGLSAYGYKAGNIYKVVGGLDADHNICGATEGFEKFNKLYISDLSFGDSVDDVFKTGVCVQTCPVIGDTALECMPNSHVKCADQHVVDVIQNTMNFANLYCIPQNLNDLPEEWHERYDQVIIQVKGSQAGNVIDDLQQTKNSIYICLGLGLVYSIAFIYMMSEFSNCLAKFSILMIELCMLGAVFAAFFLRSTTSTEREQHSYLIGGVVASVVFILFNMFLCCFWKQIEVAIAVIDATADFFAATKRIIFTPVIYFFASIIVITVWMAGCAGIISLNKVSPSFDSPQGRNVEWTENVKMMLGFMIIGLVWILFWIQDNTSFICMVSASSFYFDSSKEKEGHASVLTGYKYAYFKHAGSLALGSLLHTFFTILRIIIEGTSDAFEKSGQNAVAKCLFSCVKCCLRCVENMVEYINSTAYAYMAVSGDAYCTSAWNGFMLNLKHHASYSFATALAHMFIFLGKIFIASVNCATYFLLVKYGFKNFEVVHSMTAPMIIVAFFSFVMAHIFLCLFNEATTATLHCLAIDLDLNEGKPVYGPPSFHAKIEKVFGDHKKKQNKIKQWDQETLQTYQPINQLNPSNGSEGRNRNQMM